MNILSNLVCLPDGSVTRLRLSPRQSVRFLLLSLFLCVSVWNASSQQLVSVTYLGSKTQAQILSQFNNLPFIQYGAKYYRIAYTTHDVHGVQDTATGLIAVPDNPNRKYPRLVYQHGTAGSRTGVPSLNYDGGEGQVGLLFASLGYVAFLPDYLGLGLTSRGFHPYVHAASEAWAALDMLRAGEQFCQQLQVSVNAQLFITGYSQGGHGAMALHRAIEKDPSNEFMVTAAAPLSGPYSISGVMRDLILTDTVYYYPAYIPNTALSYQTAYGNLFTQVNEMFKEPYAALIQSFYDGSITLSDLNDDLIDALIANEGASRPYRMMQPDYVNAVLANPQHPVNLALADNDTYKDWLPEAPMRILYCMADDQVPFRNSIVARDALTAIGAPDFQAQDVLPTGDHGDCYVPAMTGTLFFFLGFQQIGTVDTEEEVLTESLEVSPSPATAAVTIEIPARGILRVVDMEGRILIDQSVEAGRETIQAGALAPGMYAVLLTSETGTRMGRLLVGRQ